MIEVEPFFRKEELQICILKIAKPHAATLSSSRKAAAAKGIRNRLLKQKRPFQNNRKGLSKFQSYRSFNAMPLYGSALPLLMVGTFR